MAGKETKPRYSARRPFDYAGQSLDRGQVFQLIGAPNDEKLIRLGYVAELPTKAEVFTCGVCGAEFIDMGSRTHHGDKRHRVRELDPREEDLREEREEKQLETLAPLYLENTLASAGG